MRWNPKPLSLARILAVPPLARPPAHEKTRSQWRVRAGGVTLSPHSLVQGVGRVMRSKAVLLAIGLFSTGCIGGIRETTTARTSTEQLLISTAAERAIAGFEN